ncbi:MAG: acyl-CoA carboxylase subunit beta [Candidatus Thermoplasmatota archaeon]|nr:acyl-CoA carboxylase subunit beta [Candidatus Thermoplasmatota archaeon]MCL5983806.1 acyl-CoA carboxylase subunit beta [Candidatus Thermoplasmatota archaeon]
MSDAFDRWEVLKRATREGGGAERVAKHHAAGKLTARERLEAFFDSGTFEEIGAYVTTRATSFGMAERRIPGDGVVTGWGEVDARPVCAFAQDATVFGGALGEAHAAKIVAVMELARKAGVPIVGLNDSGGARIQEGVVSLGGYGEVFWRNVSLSGVVPQVSAILGPCAGGAVYSPALTDFVVMAHGTSQMFITGPDVVKEVTGEEVSTEDLGGADAHARQSGVSHLTAANDKDALELVRRLLGYLPLNNLEEPPRAESVEPAASAAAELARTVPEDPNAPYDVREVIDRVLDPGSFLEIQPEWAMNIVVGLARLSGRSIGVIANNPSQLAGTLDINASVKAARFVRTCDAFNVPLLTFVDVPGFLPGTAQEHGGIIRHGAKLLYAYAEATVPMMTVILRKAYGGAYDVMCSKHLGGDLNFAWPGAEIAVMGAEGAAKILFRRSGEGNGGMSEEERARRIRDYRTEFMNPFLAAERGYIDDVIDPTTTRARLVAGLRMLSSKRDDRPPKKHGNGPL